MKNHTFLLYKLLEMCKIMTGERTLNGLINILIGKQNHQTWADIHYYHIYPFYRLLSKDEVEYAIQQLIHQQLVSLNGNNQFTITDLGKTYLAENRYNSTEVHRDGRIIPAMMTYWSFLHLLIQTLSNLLYQYNHFLPIVRDVFIQQKVKHWIATHGIQAGAKGLFNELDEIFSILPVTTSNLLVSRLSGYHRISHSLTQVAKQQRISLVEAKWNWEGALTHLYQVIGKVNFQYVPKMKEESELVLSASCQQTRKLLEQNINLSEISSIRNIKENTALDHIIEVALIDPNFDYLMYITKEQLEQVKCIYMKSRSFRLKIYKEQLPHLHYFHIRLALAVLSRGNDDEL